MPTTRSSSAGADSASVAALAALARLVLDYRLVTLIIAIGGLRLAHLQLGDLALLLALGLFNAAPLLRWERLAPLFIRHPTILALDCVVTLGVLLITGVDGPLLSYTMGTAFLAGVLYRRAGAAVFASLLVAGYLYVLEYAGPAPVNAGFQALVGTPSLYVLLAFGAAAVGELLERQARVEAELTAVRAYAAAAEERSRLARELHDSLGKTLHGITLLAGALPRWVERDPDRAVVEARTLASSAQGASEQARELLRGMRADRLDLPLEAAVRTFLHSWSRETGRSVAQQLDRVDDLPVAARYELFWILREALRNVHRHSGAEHVTVTLRSCGSDAVLTIADDGVGLAEGDPRTLALRGHFGILGMQERAELAGGTLEIGPGPAGGTTLVVRVPRGAPEQQARLAEAGASS